MSKEQRGEKIEESPSPSRLGKEAKIGVAVIALLLIVLGVVVTVRLMGSGPDDKVAGEKDDHHGRPGDGKVDAMLKDIRPRPALAPPTVVSAKAASFKPPKPADSGLDRWKIASDADGPKPPMSNRGPGLGAPPIVPDPPKPPMADRSSRYALDPPVDKDFVEVKDSHKDITPREGRGMKDLVVEVEDSGRYRDHSRFGSTPPAPQPSQHPRSTPSFSNGLDRPAPPVTPVGQYAADDYRRPQAPPSYRTNEPRPRPTPSYGVMPPKREDGKYEVQPNDSYWIISEKLYGTGAYFKALAELNRGRSEGDDRLKPGSLIQAPDVAQLEKSFPDLCPKASRREAMASQNQSRTMAVSTRGSYRGGRTYTVVEGDTLFNIARYELGKASRWAEIYELNRDVLGKDFNYLTPGTQLTLPSSEKSTEIIAEPPRDVFRR